METANYWFIFSAVGHLMVAEAKNGGPLGLLPDVESNIKEAFAAYIKPQVLRWPEKRIQRLRLSLAYFINKPRVLEYDVLANVQDLTMPEPSDYQQFFRWLYEVLFPDQPMEEIDLSDVQEDNDVMQMNFEPGELSKE